MWFSTCKALNCYAFEKDTSAKPKLKQSCKLFSACGVSFKIHQY